MSVKTLPDAPSKDNINLITPELIEQADRSLPKQRFTEIIPAAKTRNLVGGLSQPDQEIADSLSEIADKVNETQSRSISVSFEDQEYTVSLEEMILLQNEQGYNKNVLDILSIKHALIYEVKGPGKARYIVLFNDDKGILRSYAQLVRHEKPSTKIGKVLSAMTPGSKDRMPFFRGLTPGLEKLFKEGTISKA